MSSDTDSEAIRRRIASAHALPAAYREQMWQAISREWSAQVTRRSRVRAGAAWGGLGVGFAAAMVLGIFIGRVSYVPGVGGEDYRATALIVEGAAVESQLSTPYRVALGEHLTEAETLLVLFGNSQETDDELASLARDLAATTRLLMDSDAGEDAQLRRILLDLELVLVQISRLVDASDATERQVVREGLEDSTVLPRLRRLIPERPSSLGI